MKYIYSNTDIVRLSPRMVRVGESLYAKIFCHVGTCFKHKKLKNESWICQKKITYLTRTGKRWASLEFDSIFFLEGLGVGNGKWMIMIIKNKD